MNIPYVKETLCKYDLTMSSNLYFVDELNNSSYKISSSTRYLINKDIYLYNKDTYLYIASLKILDNGSIISIPYKDGMVGLIKISTTYYLLKNSTLSIHDLKNIMYTLCNQFNCFIDVTSFASYFNEALLIYLYMKTKSFHKASSNLLITQLCKSNMLCSHNSFSSMGYLKKDYFYSVSNNLKVLNNYYTTLLHKTYSSCKLIKENCLQEVSISEFANTVNKVKEFESYHCEEELKDIYSYRGSCLVIKEDNQIVAGACVQMVLKDYIFLSYIFSLKKGQGSKLLSCLESYATSLKKGILLECKIDKVRKWYEEKGFCISNESFPIPKRIIKK